MIVTKNLFYSDDNKYIVALGKFDGLHKGHYEIISKMLECRAKYKDSKLCIITFSSSPKAYMGLEEERLLLSLDIKREAFAALGIDLYIECEFDDKVRNIKADYFVDKILRDNLHTLAFVAGEDVRFGQNAEGDAKFLRKYVSENNSFDLEIIPKLSVSDEVISSTAIAEFIRRGDMYKAAEMLGRNYEIEGIVQKGKSLGNRWGVPTVNVLPDCKMAVPAFGVYFSTIDIEGKSYKSITNIGVNPTTDFDEGIVKTETFILDYEGNAYNKSVRIQLLEFIRPEKKFESLEALYNQIENDIENRKKCQKY